MSLEGVLRMQEVLTSVHRQLDSEFVEEGKSLWAWYLEAMKQAWTAYSIQHDDYSQRRIIRLNGLLAEHGLMFGEDTKYGTHTIVPIDDRDAVPIRGL